jgi:AraC-like DNA-binding protein
MAQGLRYVEHLPSSELAPWVACFWQISGVVPDSAPFLHRVLPDGCADLLFNLEGARRARRTPAEVVGPMSRAQVFGLHGAVETIGVRLRPGAFGAFTGIPADKVLDDSAPISELPHALRVNIAELADTATFDSRAALLTEVCRERVAALDGPDPVIRHALSKWRPSAERALPAVSVLTRDIGLSERAFERRFVAHVGLTPVRYRRLARFRLVLRLHAGGLRDWSELAATTGFSDQSHLVRDYRAFTGLTPTEWAADQAARAGFLQDGNVTAL